MVVHGWVHTHKNTSILTVLGMDLSLWRKLVGPPDLGFCNTQSNPGLPCLRRFFISCFLLCLSGGRLCIGILTCCLAAACEASPDFLLTQPRSATLESPTNRALRAPAWSTHWLLPCWCRFSYPFVPIVSAHGDDLTPVWAVTGVPRWCQPQSVANRPKPFYHMVRTQQQLFFLPKVQCTIALAHAFISCPTGNYVCARIGARRAWTLALHSKGM